MTAEFSESLSPDKMPRHVAIIMDGNGRWAKSLGKPRLYGHQQGAEALRRAIRAAIELKIPYLTVWAFSTENWSRPPQEITGLMTLMKTLLPKELGNFNKNNIRLRVAGLRDKLSPDLIQIIDQAVESTQNNTGLTLTIAFNYGGRADILQAAQRIASAVHEGTLKPQEVTEDLFSNYLLTADIPDPDLIIRSAPDYRLSNFMMWQGAYAELVFLETYWPDFDKTIMINALQEYQKRERRFGGLKT